MNRRHWLVGTLAAAGTLPTVLRAVPANGWSPTKPLRIVANAAGSILDVAARQIADRISTPMGQAVIVENKPGAGGLVTMETVARSAPDGHTVAITTFVEMTVNPWLFERLPYDPVRDFAPVTVLYTGPQMLVSHPGFAPLTLAELMKLARAEPGRHMYGSSGIARPPHIFMEKFKLAAGVDLPHVPYRGAPPLLQAVLSGEVPLAIEGTAAVLPLVRAGRLKALAVSGTSRLVGFPDVATFEEAGIPGIGLAWVGLVAPAGTPSAAVARWHREVTAALRDPVLRADYDLAGRTAVGNSPEEVSAWIRRDLAEWRDVVARTRLKLE